MNSADDINKALEDVEQSALRNAARRAVKDPSQPKHFYSSEDTFDTVPGSGLVVRRNHPECKSIATEDLYGFGEEAPTPDQVALRVGMGRSLSMEIGE